MSLRQVLLPEAAEWYESGRPGLGSEFVGAVDAMSAAASTPLAAAPWPGSKRFRRRVMERFPYILIYEVRPDAIEFVAHTSRVPGYWLRRDRRASE
jgi:hypothetical protein